MRSDILQKIIKSFFGPLGSGRKNNKKSNLYPCSLSFPDSVSSVAVASFVLLCAVPRQTHFLHLGRIHWYSNLHRKV
ncbi:hypothetical protein L1887_45903 [Cichorium endivia]|nr:hypothetical protein L1887_45903 [Cichorium endivia]